MPKFRLIISYDGTDFCGWQVQPHGESVFSRLVNSFESVFGREVVLVGPSRTDSGVHALGYVASAETNLDVDSDRLRSAWNAALPESIHIRALERVADSYNPRHDILKKRYLYHLFKRRPLPFAARFGWFYEFIDLVDQNKFVQSLSIFEGEHDFRSFCRLDIGDERRTVRKLDKVRLSEIKRYDMLQVSFEARGFLRYQVRRMIGAALEVARRPELSVAMLSRMLKTGKPESQFLTFCAPAKGLCLRKIVYGGQCHE